MYWDSKRPIVFAEDRRCRRNWSIESRRWRARAVFIVLAMIINGKITGDGTRAKPYTRATLWCRTLRPRRRTMKMILPCQCRIKRRRRLPTSRSPLRPAFFKTDSQIAACRTSGAPPSSWASKRPWTSFSSACLSPTGEFLLFSGNFWRLLNEIIII